MKKVICIGSVTRDIFVTMDETRMIENPNDITAKKLMAFEFGTKVYAQSFAEELGGGAANMAAGLAKMGIRSFVFARVSKGEDGKWILKRMSRAGIKKNYTQQTGGDLSEISVIISDKKNRDHTILRTGSSVEHFNLAKALDKFREKADWLLISSQKTNWQENFKLLIDFAKEKKAKIMLNPSGYQVANASKELAGALGNVEVFVLNRDEALELVRNVKGEVEDVPEKLLSEIKSFGAKVAVITDGEDGAYVIDNQELIYLKAAEITKGDTVGAGDAFCSGFLGGYIESEDVRTALAWGIVNSAGVVTQLGGTQGLPSKKELKKQAEGLLGKVEKL